MSKSQWLNARLIVDVQMKKETHDYLASVISIFFETIRGIYYHRTINGYINQQEQDWHQSHIIYLSSMNLDISVMGWAKLFGSEQSQDAHFMHLFRYDDLRACLSGMGINSKDDLEVDLLDKINVDKDEFDNYKNNSIIKYRDKFVAHMDLKLHVRSEDSAEEIAEKKVKQLKAYPELDLAEKSLYWFYEFIFKLIKCMKSHQGNYQFAIYESSNIRSCIERELSDLSAALLV